jgi:hypothetical protein
MKCTTYKGLLNHFLHAISKFVSHIALVGYLPPDGGGNSATELWQTHRHYPRLHQVISASQQKKEGHSFKTEGALWPLDFQYEWLKTIWHEAS